MNKTVRLDILGLAALTFVTLVGAIPAAAAGPTNTFPGGSTAVDNQTHTIAANSSLWYNFVYAGDRSLITLTLVNGNNSGVAFNVFTPAQIGDWWETPPIGRGTVLQLNCTTGLPAPFGACQSDDLSWNGQFNAADKYFVQVVNNNSNPVNFTLTIEGSGVTMAPQSGTAGTALTPPATAVIEPTTNPVVTVPPGSNVDPGHAVFIDNNSHPIPANSSLWYKFDYAGDKSEITIALVNGTNSGMGFNVFTPGQIGDWWDEAPIGRGTAQALDCSTGLPTESGGCVSNDSTWVGKFNAPGPYFVQVWNLNAVAKGAQLTIQGDGVSLNP